jgi:hypothetical protein
MSFTGYWILGFTLLATFSESHPDKEINCV